MKRLIFQSKLFKTIKVFLGNNKKKKCTSFKIFFFAIIWLWKWDNGKKTQNSFFVCARPVYVQMEEKLNIFYTNTYFSVAFYDLVCQGENGSGASRKKEKKYLLRNKIQRSARVTLFSALFSHKRKWYDRILWGWSVFLCVPYRNTFFLSSLQKKTCWRKRNAQLDNKKKAR